MVTSSPLLSGEISTAQGVNPILPKCTVPPNGECYAQNVRDYHDQAEPVGQRNREKRYPTGKYRIEDYPSKPEGSKR